MIDPDKTMEMFRDSHEEYSVPGIEEGSNPTSETEYKPENNI